MEKALGSSEILGEALVLGINLKRVSDYSENFERPLVPIRT